MIKITIAAVSMIALSLGACASAPPPPDHVMQADWTRIHKATDTLLDRPTAEYFWAESSTAHVGRVRLAGGEPPCRRVEMEIWRSPVPVKRFSGDEPNLPLLRRIFRTFCPNDGGVFVRAGKDERDDDQVAATPKVGPTTSVAQVAQEFPPAPAATLDDDIDRTPTSIAKEPQL